MLYCQKYN